MIASKRTRGLRQTYKPPIPFGPYNLWLEKDIKSTFNSCTLTGTLPTDCVASTWKIILRERHISPIVLISWITPISLLTCITETKMVSGRIAASNFAKSNKPSCSGSK